MNIRRVGILSMVMTSGISAMYQAQATTQTMDGVISDSMWVKKHMMPGKSNAECIKECAKDGSTYVLVVGDKSYSLKAKTETIAPFAGKHVQVHGDLKQDAISVAAIHQAKGAAHAGMKM